MPVDPIKSKNEFNTRSSEAAAAPAKSVATHEDSTLKSAGSKSDDSFDCFACVKYYASAALDGVYYVCDFVYNLLFGTKTPEKPKAEEKPKAPEKKEEEKPKREDTAASSTAAPAPVPTKQPESPKPAAEPAVVPAVVKEAPKKEEKKNEERAAAPTPVRTEQPEPTKPVAEVAPEAPAAKLKGNPKIIKTLQDNYVKYKEETIEKIKKNPKEALSAINVFQASIAAYNARGSKEATIYFAKTKFFDLSQLAIMVKQGIPASMLTLAIQSLPAPYDIFEEPTAVELALPSTDVKEEPKKAENKSEERAASPVPVTLYTPAVELPKPVVAPLLVVSGPKEKGDPAIIRVLQEGYEKGKQVTINRIRQVGAGQVMAAIADFMEKINGDEGRGSKEASIYFNKSKLMELGFSTTPFEQVLPGLESLPAPFDIFEMSAAVTPAVQPAAVRVEPKKEPQTKADLAKTQLVRQQSTEIVAGRLLQLQTNFEKAKAYALATIAEGKEDAADVATQFLDRIGQGEETKNKDEIVKGTKEHNKYAFEITLDVRQAANNRELQDNAARLQALKAKIAEIKSPHQFFAAQWPKPTHAPQVIAQLQANFASAKAAALTKIENRQEKAVGIASAFMKQVMTESLASKEEASKYSEAVMMPFFFDINDSNDLAILLTSIQTLKSPEDFFKTLKA